MAIRRLVYIPHFLPLSHMCQSNPRSPTKQSGTCRRRRHRLGRSPRLLGAAHVVRLLDALGLSLLRHRFRHAPSAARRPLKPAPHRVRAGPHSWSLRTLSTPPALRYAKSDIASRFADGACRTPFRWPAPDMPRLASRTVKMQTLEPCSTHHALRVSVDACRMTIVVRRTPFHGSRMTVNVCRITVVACRSAAVVLRTKVIASRRTDSASWAKADGSSRS